MFLSPQLETHALYPTTLVIWVILRSIFTSLCQHGSSDKRQETRNITSLENPFLAAVPLGVNKQGDLPFYRPPLLKWLMVPGEGMAVIWKAELSTHRCLPDDNVYHLETDTS